MSWVVAIPSYRRPNELKKKTLKTLKEGGVPASKIYVFVVKDQLKEYEEILEPDTYNKLIVGKVGLDNQRVFISDYFPKGQHIVSLDDDIKSIVKIVGRGEGKGGSHFKKMTNIPEFFTNAFKIAKEKGAGLWGVFPIPNSLYTNTVRTEAVSTRLSYIIGAFYGYVNSKDPKIKLKLGDAMEDRERTLLYFIRDGTVVRFNHVSFHTNFFAPGGMDSPTRRKEHEIGAKELEKRYPGYVKAHLKPPDRLGLHPNGLWDIRFLKLKAGETPETKGLKEGSGRGDESANELDYQGNKMPPKVDITDEDRNNTEIKYLPIRNKSKYDEARAHLLEVLKDYSVPKLPQPTLTAHSNRGNIIGTIGRTTTFGFGDTRRGWNHYKTNVNHPDVFKALVAFGNQVVPKGWEYQGITLNHGVKAKKHVDSKNVGGSVIIGIGDFTGGKVRVWNEDNKNPQDKDIHDKPLWFNGGLLPHETQPFKGDRYTIIYYKQQRKPKSGEIGIGKGHTLDDYSFPTNNGAIFA